MEVYKEICAHKKKKKKTLSCRKAYEIMFYTQCVYTQTDFSETELNNVFVLQSIIKTKFTISSIKKPTHGFSIIEFSVTEIFDIENLLVIFSVLSMLFFCFWPAAEYFNNYHLVNYFKNIELYNAHHIHSH